jgi:hypothetical protein
MHLLYVQFIYANKLETIIHNKNILISNISIIRIKIGTLGKPHVEVPLPPQP